MIMKVFFEKFVLGQIRLVNYTTVPGIDVGMFLDAQGVAGKPFGLATVPAGRWSRRFHGRRHRGDGTGRIRRRSKAARAAINTN